MGITNVINYPQGGELLHEMCVVCLKEEVTPQVLEVWVLCKTVL